MDGGGGGIQNDSTMTVIDSTFIDNSASWGGGIRSDGTLTLTGSTFSGNTASHGGGFGNYGRAFVRNSTFSGNSADYFGGGILNVEIMAVNNSTLNSNSAGTGGGISGDHGTVTVIGNNIIANSLSGGDCSGGLISLGYNLDSDNSCNLTAVGDIPNTDPLLGPLQANGGAAFTHALQLGSPAIDAGNPAASGSDVNACESTDQRGVVRPRDGDNDSDPRCDMGAYEVASLSILPVAPPIVIPPEGGSFFFQVVLTNITHKARTGQAWIMVDLPDGTSYGPVQGPMTLTVSPGQTVMSTLEQDVPAPAPAGHYDYILNVGQYPDIILDSDSFTFTKE